jgi:hypothetical protein
MQTTAGEARGAGQRHSGPWGRGGGGAQPTKGLGEEKTWHALFDSLQTIETTQWSQENGLLGPIQT